MRCRKRETKVGMFHRYQFPFLQRRTARERCLVVFRHSPLSDDLCWRASALPRWQKTLASQGRKGSFRGTTLFRPAHSPTALGETITSLKRLRLSDNSVQRSDSQATFNRGPVRACSRWPFSLIPGLVCLLFLFVVFDYSTARRPWRDSNAQPLPPQGSALSIELQGLVAGR